MRKPKKKIGKAAKGTFVCVKFLLFGITVLILFFPIKFIYFFIDLIFKKKFKAT